MGDSQLNIFCIPETPRPNVEKKSSLLRKEHSLDFFKGSLPSLKS
jgi:hypothetical protein